MKMKEPAKTAFNLGISRYHNETYICHNSNVNIQHQRITHCYHLCILSMIHFCPHHLLDE